MTSSTILFDLDGTLVDSSIGIYNSYCAALSYFNCTIDLKTLKNKIGPPVPVTLQTLFPDLFSDEKNLRKALSEQRKYYRKKGFCESKVYPGIVTLLDSLEKSGKILCVATSKPTLFAKKILIHQNLLSYFDVVIGSTLNLSRTKKTDIIAAVLKKFKSVSLDKIIMIGDRHHDIDGAKENNIASIGVTYGFGSENEILAAKPSFIAHNTAELKGFLCAQ